jgi:hypothetical protein
MTAQRGVAVCKETLLERRHLIDASRDEYQYAQTYAKQRGVKHKLSTQQSNEKDWQAEATPHE